MFVFFIPFINQLLKYTRNNSFVCSFFSSSSFTSLLNSGLPFLPPFRFFFMIDKQICIFIRR